MTDKVVRDELLRSHRYQSLSNDTAKLLFVHLMLSSDSLSNTEATSTAVSIIMGRTITEEATSTLLSEIADRDLIRIYTVDGKRYVHIPRSRQRIRYLRGKHPRPPVEVEDREIKALIEKVGLQSDRGQTQVSLKTARSEAKRSVVAVAEELEKTLVVADATPQAQTAKKKAKSTATRLPGDWELPDPWLAWAVTYRTDWNEERVLRESLVFRDHWLAAPGQKGTKNDWEATWRNWVRRAT